MAAPKKVHLLPCTAFSWPGPTCVCSQSINTEGEERLFNQANSAAQNADHKGLLPTLGVSLQRDSSNPG